MKAWLSHQEVPFEERNVFRNRGYWRELVDDLGYTTVPVIRVDDRVIAGFDQRQLKEALNIK